MNVGILGGGQLGRMLALAGYPLGLRFRFLEPKADSPVAHLGEVIHAEYDDPDALARFAEGLDAVTYEFENVPEASARLIEQAGVPVYPAAPALEMAQDRLAEKKAFGELGIPTARWVAVDSLDELAAGLDELGTPAVLKTRRLGYDGKGQFVLERPEQVDEAWAFLGGAPLLLEAFVEFDRELSVLAVRGRDGSAAAYPLVENHHEGGILRVSLAPARGVTPHLQATARDYAGRVMERLGYVGVLAIELFQWGDQLLANELAPRVHNSGHWTIDGARCSQFENHLRAVCGLPLGSTSSLGYSAMVNLIGTLPDPASVLEMPGAHLHLYDKSPRPGRKLGHVTVVWDNEGAVREAADRLHELARAGTGAPAAGTPA